MKDKINIAKLLKDCPKGMELDCTMFEGIEFDSIVDNETFPIRCRIKNSNDEYNFYNFTKHGYWNNDYKAKCVIFPKSKTTWEGFVPPCKFKDGDVITCYNRACTFVSIFKDKPFERSFRQHCSVILDDNKFTVGIKYADYANPRLATEGEKEKLFQTIKDNGYKWNAETKTLEKLKTSKFVLNSIVRRKGTDIHYRVEEQRMSQIKDFVEYEYKLRNIIDNSTEIVYDVDEDDYELAPNKFDITTLKPFDKVLYRMHDKDTWCNSFYCFYKSNHHFITSLTIVRQCIPYEGNEHLLNTTNDCDDFYKTWEK